MTKPKTLEKEPISIYDAKRILEKNKKKLGEDEALNFRAEKTLEYIHNVAKVPYKTIDELRKKIEDLNIPRLKEQHISKIIDILPSTDSEVSAVLKEYPLTILKEDIKKIAEVVKDTIDEKHLV